MVLDHTLDIEKPLNMSDLWDLVSLWCSHMLFHQFRYLRTEYSKILQHNQQQG